MTVAPISFVAYGNGLPGAILVFKRTVDLINEGTLLAVTRFFYRLLAGKIMRLCSVLSSIRTRTQCIL